MRRPRIGVLLTPIDTHYERFDVDQRPWMKKMMDDPAYKSHTDGSDGGVQMTKDFAVYAYLKGTYSKEFDVVAMDANQSVTDHGFWSDTDFIYWGAVDIVTARFSPHGSGGIQDYDAYIRLIKQYSYKLIGGDYDYATWIEHKCDYYTSLQAAGFPVAPFTCIGRYATKHVTAGNEQVRAAIADMFKRSSTNEVFIKPSGGYASIDVKSSDELEDAVTYAKGLLKKYEEVIVSKFVHSFGYTLECRFFFIGDTLRYSLFNDAKGNFYDDTNYKTDAPWWCGLPELNTVRKLALKTFRFVVDRFFQGSMPIHTRIDLGCCMDDDEFDVNNPGSDREKLLRTYFVNEIEFGHGWVTHMDENQFWADKHVGDAIVEAVRMKEVLVLPGTNLSSGDAVDDVGKASLRTEECVDRLRRRVWQKEGPINAFTKCGKTCYFKNVHTNMRDERELHSKGHVSPIISGTPHCTSYVIAPPARSSQALLEDKTTSFMNTRMRLYNYVTEHMRHIKNRIVDVGKLSKTLHYNYMSSGNFGQVYTIRFTGEKDGDNKRSGAKKHPKRGRSDALMKVVTNSQVHKRETETTRMMSEAVLARKSPHFALLLSHFVIKDMRYTKGGVYRGPGDWVRIKKSSNSIATIVENCGKSMDVWMYEKGSDLAHTMLPIIAQMCMAIEAMRFMGVTHGDLYTTNVTMKELAEPVLFHYSIDGRPYYVMSKKWVPIVIDFGQSTHYSKHTPLDKSDLFVFLTEFSVGYDGTRPMTHRNKIVFHMPCSAKHCIESISREFDDLVVRMLTHMKGNQKATSSDTIVKFIHPLFSKPPSDTPRHASEETFVLD